MKKEIVDKVLMSNPSFKREYELQEVRLEAIEEVLREHRDGKIYEVSLAFEILNAIEESEEEYKTRHSTALVQQSQLSKLLGGPANPLR